MASIDPTEAAIAVARAAQDPDGLGQARSLILDYTRDGLDPLHLAYSACQLLALADEAIARLTIEERGDWLSKTALQAAAAIDERRGSPS